MGEEHPLGVMADPRELLRALKALGAIDRMPARRRPLRWNAAPAAVNCGGWSAHTTSPGSSRRRCSWPAEPPPDAAYQSTSVLQAGWEFFGGASAAEDATRVALLEAMARRLVDLLTLMVARKRRGDGDELLSPLVMPALPIASALAGVLDAAALESGEHDDPRKELPQVLDQLRGMADLLDTMTPGEN